MKRSSVKVTRQQVLNSACGHLNLHLSEPVERSAKKVKLPRQDSKEVQEMYNDLRLWTWDIESRLGIKLTLQKELKFLENRKFQFDFAINEWKLAIEYDGINSEKSGHTTLPGVTKDREKDRLAQLEGWTIWRYTVISYKQVIRDLEQYLIIKQSI